MKLSEFILRVASGHQRGPRHIQPGHNGPYHDPETPVRNLSHWLIILSACDRIAGGSGWTDSVKDYADYLVSKEARPFGYSFHHRDKPGKDHCNGLVGQAWTIEALAEASAALNDPVYADVGREVFRIHGFSNRYGLWRRLDIHGESLPFDMTFNHQLWFAAAASLLIGEDATDIRDKVLEFLDNVPSNMTVLPNGLLFHPIARVMPDEIFKAEFPFGMARKAASNVKRMLLRAYAGTCFSPGKKPISHQVYRSIGYHAFNLYAFAVLKRQLPSHDLWRDPSFNKLISYSFSGAFKDAVTDNSYGFPYNPVGFEMPFVVSVFSGDTASVKEESRYWIQRQLDHTYNNQTNRLDRNTTDPSVLTARLYELCRLPVALMKGIEVTV